MKAKLMGAKNTKPPIYNENTKYGYTLLFSKSLLLPTSSARSIIPAPLMLGWLWPMEHGQK